MVKLLTGREREAQPFCTQGLHKKKWGEKSLLQRRLVLLRGSDGKVLTKEIPVILPETEGFATAIPAAALVTETAGVRIPSAIVNPVAKRH